MDKFFKISERNSTVRAEVIGGITTFFTMGYIVIVNPNSIAANGANGWLAALGADPTTLSQIWNAVFIGSIIAAIIGTLLMGLYAKLPYAMACGMGLNSFFCTYFIYGAFITSIDLVAGYHSGMIIIFLSGLLFFILTMTKARNYLVDALPDPIKKASAAGIGLFISYIGFLNAGIIQDNAYNLVQFIELHQGDWVDIAPALTAFIGLAILGILAKKKVKYCALISILASTVIYYILMGTTPNFNFVNPITAFKDFTNLALPGLFDAEGWKVAFTSPFIGGPFEAIILIISLCVIDIYDTIGTIFGTATYCGMVDENGDPLHMDKALKADAIGTMAGAICGTSPCTAIVASSSGLSVGARTGLANVVTALCFAACILLTPLASIVPTAATAPALIYVGILMMKSFVKVDMEDIASAIPAFLTFIMMLLTYSAANGIGVGAISYVIISLFTKKFDKKDIFITIVAILFVLKFMFVTWL